jgi:hypothetical protein
MRFVRRLSPSSVSSSLAVCQPGSFKGMLTGLCAQHYSMSGMLLPASG